MQLFGGTRVGSKATVVPSVEDRLRALRLVFLVEPMDERLDFLEESLPDISVPTDPKLENDSCPLNDE